MSDSPRVLVVDDQVGDIEWLLDRILYRGYEIVVATNERAARKRLDAVKKGEESYALAIVDVMVAIMDLADLVTLDEEFFVESRDTGIRLCRYVREELGISPNELPIVSLTVRDDPEVKAAMEELGIPLVSREPGGGPADLLDEYLERHLPRIARSSA
jgi:CheY-like chemotaxis protein